MQEDVLVSIVIPMFNAERYIRKTIDSLFAQTYKNLEIILIDDCSTDKTPQICKKIIESKANIKYFKNDSNLGAANSRNLGIEHASGEYLLILDADDEFSSDLVEKSLLKAKEANADVVVYGYQETFVMTGEKRFYRYDEEIVEEIPKHTLDYLGKARTVAWNKLYKTSLIRDNNIKFQDIPTENDVFFSYAALLFSKKTVFIKDMLVNYNHGNIGSISNTRDLNNSNIVRALDACYGLSLRVIPQLARQNLIDDILTLINQKYTEYQSIDAKNTILLQMQKSQYLLNAIKTISDENILDIHNKKVVCHFAKTNELMLGYDKPIDFDELSEIKEQDEVTIFGYGQAGRILEMFIKEKIKCRNIRIYDKNAHAMGNNRVCGKIEKDSKVVVGFINNDKKKIQSARYDLDSMGINEDNIILVDMLSVINVQYMCNYWDKKGIVPVSNIKKCKNDRIKKVCFVSYGYEEKYDSFPVGGPIGALVMQKKLLHSFSDELVYEFPYSKIEQIRNMGDVLSAGAAIDNIKLLADKETLFFCNDIFSAYGCYLEGVPYVLLNHMQGDDVSEAVQRGISFAGDIKQRYLDIEKITVENAEQVIFPSNGAEIFFRQKLPFKVKMTVGMPLYNSIYDFPKAEKVDGVDYDKNAITFLTVAQLIETKGVDLIPNFIKKYADIAKKKVRWILVGKGYLDDVIDTEMQKITNEDSNIEYIHLNEYITHGQIFGLMQLADIYLLLHRVSIFDFSTLEAMYNGLHIVLSDIPGNREFNIDNNVYLYNFDDDFQNIQNYIEDENIGNKNKALYKKIFSQMPFNERYYEAIHSIICTVTSSD